MSNLITTWVYGYQGNPAYTTSTGLSVAFPVDKINIRELSPPQQYSGVDCYSMIEILTVHPPNPVYFSSDTATTLINAANSGGGGGGAYSVVTVFANYTETATSGQIVILCDTTAGAITVSLPTAVGNTAEFSIKKIAGSNNVIIDPAGSEAIDGGTTATLVVTYESITIISDNANWHII